MAHLTLEAKIAIFAIAIAVVIPILTPFIHLPFQWAIIVSVVIIVISLFVIFWNTIKIIRQYFQSPIKRPTKGKEIPEPSTTKEITIDVCDEENLPSWNELFSNTEHEIMIQGVTIESLNRVRTSIESAAKQGRKVRILLCHPEISFMREIETLVVSISTKSRIQSCVNMIYQTLDNLGRNDKQNLEIKWHKEIPTMSLVISDDYMQIEPYTYEIPKDKRKILRINRNQQKELFDVYLKAFENLWNDAKPADRTTPQSVP